MNHVKANILGVAMLMAASMPGASAEPAVTVGVAVGAPATAATVAVAAPAVVIVGELISKRPFGKNGEGVKAIKKVGRILGFKHL